MSNAPDDIWASAGETWDGEVEGLSWDDGLFTISKEDPYQTQYTRTDKMPTWQPIETAPKDGSVVLLYGHGGTHQPCWFSSTNNEWNTSWKGLGDIFRYPTHWMPLPAPPK